MTPIKKFYSSARWLVAVSAIATLGPAFLPAAVRALSTTRNAEQDLPAGQRRVVIPVEGMTCGGCEAAIKMEVKKLEGIVAANADHKEGTATVTFVEEKVSVEQIMAAINKTGFKASAPEQEEE